MGVVVPVVRSKACARNLQQHFSKAWDSGLLSWNAGKLNFADKMNTYLGCVNTEPRRPHIGHSKPVGNNIGQQQPTSASGGGRLPTNLDRLASAFSAHAEATDSGAGHANSNQTVEVNLKRQDQEKPWGIRIQGGRDYNLQLTVKKPEYLLIANSPYVEIYDLNWDLPLNCNMLKEWMEEGEERYGTRPDGTGEKELFLI
ncbi:unnamed protein product [Dibothriocephalus latus]|uniref:Uncharacterized protein n=1 Tax=Dibothriocephalus latus TaxID=60516 RepID=A0A3P6T0E1_DIBLA|nr:unnamed protein product [Dibothriocephalus latus]